MPDLDDIEALRAENARLIALLESRGIEWRTPVAATTDLSRTEQTRLSTAHKVALFRRLFRGRTDVYPVRWESKTSGVLQARPVPRMRPLRDFFEVARSMQRNCATLLS